MGECDSDINVSHLIWMVPNYNFHWKVLTEYNERSFLFWVFKNLLGCTIQKNTFFGLFDQLLVGAGEANGCAGATGGIARPWTCWQVGLTSKALNKGRDVATVVNALRFWVIFQRQIKKSFACIMIMTFC